MAEREFSMIFRNMCFPIWRRALRVVCERALLLVGIGVSIASSAHAQGQDEFVQAPAGYVGLHIHRADQGTRWPNVAFGSWRLWDALVAWPQLEPSKGQWDFSRLDRYVAMARLTRVDLLLPLGLTPRWASTRPNEKSNYSLGNAAEPVNIEDWRNYVRTVGKRYQGRIRQFEIWNEVNDPGFYSGDAETLARLTCEASRILKEIDPANILVSPSVVGTGRSLEWHRNLLSHGAGQCIDALAQHFYVYNAAPEAVIDEIRRVRAMMHQSGVGHLPLWNTEAGWWIENTDGTPEPGADKRWKRVAAADSAAVVARALILGHSEGLSRYFLYAWDSRTMGFVEPATQAPKPAARAISGVSRWLANAKMGRCRPANAVWTCPVAATSGRQGWIVWTTGSQMQWRPPQRGQGWQVSDLAGDVVLVEDALMISGEPVLVEPRQ
jgi:hypothetical protein